MNYVASVLFATLAVVLLYVYAANEHNLFAMKLCIYVAMAGWVACYMGYVGETSKGFNVFDAASALATLAALVLYAVAVLNLRG